MPVHLNTAGAGLMPPTVLQAVTEYLQAETSFGSYETERAHADLLEHRVYQRLGQVLDAPAEDLALFDSATRAWCSVLTHLVLSADQRVWVTPYEYAGNLILLAELRKRHGFRIEIIPVTGNGDLDLAWMSANLAEDVALVSVTHVPSGCGIVNPVAEIGALLRDWPAILAVDACQSVGQLPLSVREIGCDLLTGAGRKFLRGPRGTGFAYIAPTLQKRIELPFHDLHVADAISEREYLVQPAGARRFELAERSNASVAGLSAALEHHLSLGETYNDVAIREAVRDAVRKAPETTLIDPGSTRAGVISFVHARLDADRIRDALAEQGVNVWVAKGSHTPLYLAAHNVESAVRVSPHYYNTIEDVAVFAERLSSVLRLGPAGRTGG